MPEWTFLTNHGLILSYIARHPRTTALELANAIGITERTTRNIIRDLLQAGYIMKKLEGRQNNYRVNPSLYLRHASHQEVCVGDLLALLGWKRRRSKKIPFQAIHHNFKTKNEL